MKTLDKKNITDSIVETMCYAQVFSYALKFSELHKYLHHNEKISKEKLSQSLKKNSDKFETDGEFIVLKGDRKLIKQRLLKLSENKKKTATAFFISKMLFLIPTIRLIGISGSLSVENAEKHHDIDLFIITSKNTLWFTRFIVNVVLLAFGIKRSRSKLNAKNKICPNMFMSEDDLRIPQEMQNMYTAHEVAQLKVLFSKNDTHEKFLLSNKWVLSFLPHAFNIPPNKSLGKSVVHLLFTACMFPLERVFFLAQYLLMRRYITREYISLKLVMFHPLPYSQIIQEIFLLKIEAQKIIKNKTLNSSLKEAISSLN